MPTFGQVQLAELKPVEEELTGVCSNEFDLSLNNQVDCEAAGFEWTYDVSSGWVDPPETFITIDFEEIYSFTKGLEVFDDPNSTFSAGDPSDYLTLLNMKNGSQLLIMESLDSFRSRMATLF
jgi:hypothetical protein